MTFKEKVHHYYLEVITTKIKLLQHKLNDLKEIGSNETKSTAGDKHETALAMIQIEQSNTRNQLKEILLQKEVFDKINSTTLSTHIISGSLIKTDRGYFYVSIALGKAFIDNNVIMSLSLQSPLGLRLKGLTIGNIVALNNTQYAILDVT